MKTKPCPTQQTEYSKHLYQRKSFERLVFLGEYSLEGQRDKTVYAVRPIFFFYFFRQTSLLALESHVCLLMSHLQARQTSPPRDGRVRLVCDNLIFDFVHFNIVFHTRIIP